MKTCNTFLMCLFWPGILYAQEAPKKWALLVGINNYRNVTSLQGAHNDVAYMKDLLIEKFAFPENQIVILLDERATRGAILENFESQLIARVRENDTAVFHFSGHGSQMEDVSGDEPDKKDETLVPYDSRDGDIFDISDDEINGLLTRLSKRCKNVVFIFDSCHSSTGQKPGSWRKVAPDKRLPPPAVRGIEDGDAGSLSPAANNNYVLISACGSTEVAGEIRVMGRRYGALTYHLVKALRKSDQDTTWNDIMDGVTHGLQGKLKGQTPQLHGEGDRVVFGSREMPGDSHVLVHPGSAGELEIEAGLLHGLTVGARFDVFSPGTRELDGRIPAIAQLEVTEVSDFSARARLLKGGPVPAGSRAREREHRYPGQRLYVAYKGLADSPALQALQQNLGGLDVVESVDRSAEAHLVIEHDMGADRFRFRDQNGDSMGPPLPTSSSDEIRSAVWKWAHWFRVLSIESSGPAPPNIEFNIGGGEGAKGFKQVGKTVATFRKEDEVVFEVINLSPNEVYFTVLALDSNGEIHEIYPDGEGRQPLLPHKSWKKMMVATLERDVEVEKTIIKVFATLKPIDLSFLTRPGTAKGVEPLGTILDKEQEAGNKASTSWFVVHKIAEVRK